MFKKIKEAFEAIKVIVENLTSINKKLDDFGNAIDNVGAIVESTEKRAYSILTHVITERDREDLVRYYGQMIGRNMELATESSEFSGVVVKCGILETYEIKNDEVVKIIKPFIAGENGKMFFAYPSDLIHVVGLDNEEEGDDIDAEN